MKLKQRIYFFMRKTKSGGIGIVCQININDRKSYSMVLFSISCEDLIY